MEEDPSYLYQQLLREMEALPGIFDPDCDFSSFDKWKGDRVFEMRDEVDDADSDAQEDGVARRDLE